MGTCNWDTAKGHPVYYTEQAKRKKEKKSGARIHMKPNFRGGSLPSNQKCKPCTKETFNPAQREREKTESAP